MFGFYKTILRSFKFGLLGLLPLVLAVLLFFALMSLFDMSNSPHKSNGVRINALQT